MRGLRDTIVKHRPYLYCEIISPDGDSTREQRTQEIYQLITSNDYAVFGLLKNQPTLAKVRDLTEIGDRFEQEYIFCPTELTDTFCNDIQKNAKGITVDDISAPDIN